MTTVQTVSNPKARASNITKPAEHPCLCGQYTTSDGISTECDATTNKKFAMGHDSKLKSLLIQAAVRGVSVNGKNPLAVAAEFGFETQVQAGLDKAIAKVNKKASRAFLKEEGRELRRASQGTSPARKVKAPQPPASSSMANIKVGRWTYSGHIQANGSATYLDKAGVLHQAEAGKFTVVTT